MKRSALLSLAILAASNIYAQKGIEGMIKTEQDFASYSVAKGVKDAFLANMDNGSLVFSNGLPVNGIQYWTLKEKKKAVLDWSPAFAEIAASDDFGYTTGPWTFRLSAGDSIIARGTFATVWHINKRGKWTFLVDLGEDQTPPTTATGVARVTIDKIPVAPTDTASLLNAEKDFIRLFTQDKAAAYTRYLSSAHTLVNRKGYLPLQTAADVHTWIAAHDMPVQFTVQGSVLSPSCDLGCVYGSTLVNGSADNYMRIWRHEKEGWKIALEIIRY